MDYLTAVSSGGGGHLGDGPDLDPQAYAFALAFSVFVIVMLRTNIMDVVNESRKPEPIRDVPR